MHTEDMNKDRQTKERISKARRWREERRAFWREMKDLIVVELEGRFDLEDYRWDCAMRGPR